MLAVTALAIVKQRNLFAVAMLAGIYSLLSAALFTVMDAVDVAFTEAAVGAGISTVLMLGTMAIVGHTEKTRSPPVLLPLFVVFVTGGALVYGTLDMPPYGDPANPIHHHVGDYYLEESGHEIGVPNVVTSVLASYRGYDTMGEITVIFTAMVGVLMLMAQPRRKRWSDEERLAAALAASSDDDSPDGSSGASGPDRTTGSSTDSRSEQEPGGGDGDGG